MNELINKEDINNNLKESFNMAMNGTLKSSLIKLFDDDIKYTVTKESINEIEGLFFKENLDFKLPFTYKNGEISIDVFFDLRFDMNFDKKYDILNLINYKVYDEHSFLKYVDNLTIFFNKKVNNVVSFLIKNCYFYKNFKENTEGKSATIKIVIKEKYYIYDCGVRHCFAVGNNFRYVKINIDKNFLSFEQTPFGSKGYTHSEENLLNLLITLINRFYSLHIFEIDLEKFNKIKYIEDLADMIEDCNKMQNLIKY